jgi:hypothetical protein
MVTAQPITKAKEFAPNFDSVQPEVEYWYCWIPYAGVRYYTYQYRATVADPAEQEETYRPEPQMPGRHSVDD